MSSVMQSLQQAVELHQRGHLNEAEKVYRSVIRIDPAQPDALHLLGVVQQQRGNAQAAADYIQRAITYRPQVAAYHSNLAAAYRSLGELQQAVDALQQAVRLDENYAEGWYNLGTVLRELGQYEAARDALQRAVELDPSNAGGHNNLGVVHIASGRYREAVACYRRALQHDPQLADAHNNLGTALLHLDQREEARRCYLQAVRLRPDYVEARFNLGNWYRDAGEFATAERHYREALCRQPDSADIANNLAVALKEQGRYEEALPFLEQVLHQQPDHVEARVNRSFILRLLGRFPEGWDDFDWRLRADGAPRQFSRPQWDGTPIDGQTLIIWAEQGVGDQIMFASCIPEVADRAENCLLECDPRLVPLFRRSFSGVQVFPETSPEDWPGRDVQIPLGSLPRFFRPTLQDFPQRNRYLQPDEERVQFWRKRLSQLPGRWKVGISWRGGKKPEIIRQRSTTLEQWRPLLSVPDTAFVNLQYGDCTAELRELQKVHGLTLHDWDDADPLQDLDDFAAQVAALDLVISVDNSTVHFAGALGVPCWVLLPFVPDWRWMLARDDSPWYGSLRLFRQPEAGAWAPVFQSVRQKLLDQVGGDPSAVGHSAGPTSSEENSDDGQLPVSRAAAGTAESSFVALPPVASASECQPPEKKGTGRVDEARYDWDTLDKSRHDSDKLDKSRHDSDTLAELRHDSAGTNSASEIADRQWLQENRFLRCDPALQDMPESRVEFHQTRYRFAREYCRGKRVLDVACGTGYGTAILAETASAVTGIDASAEAVDFARRKYAASHVCFLEGWAEWLPAEDRSFDVVVCFEALEHLLSPRTAFREIVRVLKPDGLAIVSVPNAWGFTRHHLTDTDFSWLQQMTAEHFGQCEFFCNNSRGFSDSQEAGISPLEDPAPEKTECLVALCRRPRYEELLAERMPAFLADAYARAFERHHHLLEMQAYSYEPLPSVEEAGELPAVQAGSTLTLETEDDHQGVHSVLLRMRTKAVACEAGNCSVTIPPISLPQPTTAQLHIRYHDGTIGSSPVIRLVPR